MRPGRQHRRSLFEAQGSACSMLQVSPNCINFESEPQFYSVVGTRPFCPPCHLPWGSCQWRECFVFSLWHTFAVCRLGAHWHDARLVPSMDAFYLLPHFPLPLGGYGPDELPEPT